MVVFDLNFFQMSKLEIAKNIMKGLAIAGTVVVAIAAPNALQAIAKFSDLMELDGWQIKRSIKKLQKKKFISLKGSGSKVTMALTEKGKNYLSKLDLKELELEPIWKQVWYLVLFDIPNTKTALRKEFVSYLKQLNLLKLQRSVWISPYECDDKVMRIASVIGIVRYVKIAKVTKIDDEEALKRYFALT